MDADSAHSSLNLFEEAFSAAIHFSSVRREIGAARHAMTESARAMQRGIAARENPIAIAGEKAFGAQRQW
jgi:hypothetical protein